MTIEHKNIADPNIHEPKGVAAASAQQVYLADGIGSGSWQDTLTSVHGEMTIDGGTTAISTSAATDSTLATDTDYTKVTADWTAGHLRNITFNTDELVVPVDGDYYISFWADLLVATNNNFVGLKYAINDTTPYSTRKLVCRAGAANDILNVAGMGITASLSANDTISMYIASSLGGNVTFKEAGLICFLLHEN